MTKDRTLSEVLHSLGYDHVAGRIHGKKSIRRGGLEVAHLTADEAWIWLRQTGQVP